VRGGTRDDGPGFESTLPGNESRSDRKGKSSEGSRFSKEHGSGKRKAEAAIDEREDGRSCPRAE
jgi:hypothetical protein